MLPVLLLPGLPADKVVLHQTATTTEVFRPQCRSIAVHLQTSIIWLASPRHENRVMASHIYARGMQHYERRLGVVLVWIINNYISEVSRYTSLIVRRGRLTTPRRLDAAS